MRFMIYQGAAWDTCVLFSRHPFHASFCLLPCVASSFGLAAFTEPMEEI